MKNITRITNKFLAVELSQDQDNYICRVSTNDPASGSAYVEIAHNKESVVADDNETYGSYNEPAPDLRFIKAAFEAYHGEMSPPPSSDEIQATANLKFYEFLNGHPFEAQA